MNKPAGKAPGGLSEALCDFPSLCASMELRRPWFSPSKSYVTTSLPRNLVAGWAYSSEKYEFVTLDDDIPNWMDITTCSSHHQAETRTAPGHFCDLFGNEKSRSSAPKIHCYTPSSLQSRSVGANNPPTPSDHQRIINVPFIHERKATKTRRPAAPLATSLNCYSFCCFKMIHTYMLTNMYITEDVFQHYTSVSHLRPGSWEQPKGKNLFDMQASWTISTCNSNTVKHGYPLIVRLNKPGSILSVIRTNRRIHVNPICYNSTQNINNHYKLWPSSTYSIVIWWEWVASK